MICPEGYITFCSLMHERPSKILKAVKREQGWIHDTCGPNLSILIGWLGQESVEDKLERLLLWAVEDELKLYHPDKGMFRFNAFPFETPNAEQSCSIFDVIDREMSYDFQQNYNLIHPDTARELFADDVEKANTKWHDWLKFESEDGSLSNHFNIPWWHERRAYVVDFAVFDAIRECPPYGVELSMFDGAVRLMRAFEGATLCVPEWYMEEKFDEKIDELIEKWHLNHEFSKPVSERKRGRPNVKLQKFKDAYRAEYPEGHGDENKGAVLDRIIGIAGCDGSIQTLDRAINEIEEEKGEFLNQK